MPCPTGYFQRGVGRAECDVKAAVASGVATRRKEVSAIHPDDAYTLAGGGG